MEKQNQPNGSGLNRRAFLGGVVPLVATASLSTWSNTVAAESPKGEPVFPGMITREKEPVNLEFPFPTLSERITPTKSFYVRGHFKIPQLSSSSWSMKISGEVKQELIITYDELRRMPIKTVMATLKCTGWPC